MKKTILALTLLTTLSGCASVSPIASLMNSTETESAFLIMDSANGPAPNRDQMFTDIANAVKTHMKGTRIQRGIPPSQLPKEPGRFQISEPFKDSTIGTLMSASAGALRVGTCEDALLTISSDDEVMGERTYFFVCMMQWAKGYRMAIYADHYKRTGLTPELIGASIGRSIVGDSRQFIPRTMGDVRTAFEKHAGPSEVADSYIPEGFKGGLVDHTAKVR